MLLHPTPHRSFRWYAKVVLAAISLCVVLRYCFYRPATTFPGAHFNQRANAAWLGVEWVNEVSDENEILSLVSDLDRRQIRYVFVYTSYLKPDGNFNPSHSHAAEYIQVLKSAQPALNVQAWIGLPLKYVDLSDSGVREAIVEFCIKVVRDMGFDGIHFDPEPIFSDDATVLTLLDEVQRALGSKPTLSVATRRIWPIFPDVRWPLVGHVAWHADYYREMARRVDQIAVMAYDSAMPLAPLYRQWMRYQVIEISRAVSGTGVQLFFGVPTSEERTWTHWPNAENMKSGLQGLVDGLNDAEAQADAVAGTAIYPYWDTDGSEWATYEALWLE